VRAIFAVTRRELASYFGSWTAYVLLAVYLVLSGYFFYSDLAFFVTFGAQNLATGLWRFVFIDYRLVTLLVLPLVTMRLFAEERKLGTIELLWTLPVRDYQLIAGKFLAAWIFFLVTVALATIPFAVLWFFHPFELGPPIAGLIGLVLLGTAFISCGLAASTLTENQVVAAALTLGLRLQAVPAVAPPARFDRKAWIPVRVRLSEFPKLKELAWQVHGTDELSPREALDIYERNWRHVDVGTLSPEEQDLVNALRQALGGGSAL